MCALLPAAVALVGVGTAASVYGQIQSGNAASRAAENEARQQEDAGKAAAARIRDQARRLEGAQITSIAGSGLEIGGSALDLIAESAANAELDARTAQVGAANAAASSRQAGRLAQYSSRWNALGTATNAGASLLMASGKMQGGGASGGGGAGGGASGGFYGPRD